jgi:hypothetical protein
VDRDPVALPFDPLCIHGLIANADLPPYVLRAGYSGAHDVGQLRVAVLGVPPLLADIIYRVVSERLQASGLTLLIVDGSSAGTVSQVVISRGGLCASLLPNEPAVLTLSADLSQILGPRPHDVAPFTPNALAARLLAIAGQQ